MNNKLYGALSYLGILVLIPMLKRENEFQHFHAEQGLTLYLISSALMLLCNCIPFLFLKTFCTLVVSFGTLVFMIIGFINVYKEAMVELPIIGKYKFLK